MGYISHLHGRIEIDPPIPWAEVKNTPYTEEANQSDFRGIHFELHTKTRAEGADEIITRTAVALVPDGESGKFYELANDLKAVAKLIGPERDANGWIIRMGEDNTDIERFGIRHGELVQQTAEIRWPDGSPVGSEY